MATMPVDRSETAGGLEAGVSTPFHTVEYLGELCGDGRLKGAVDALEDLIHKSLQAPIHTFVSLLKECGRRNSLAEGKRVHALIIQSGLDSEIFVNNNLVDMYAKCGSLIHARRVFNLMPNYNVFSWTAIISAYANHGECQEAISLFQNMRQTDVTPDKVTFLVVLKACAKISALEQGTDVHSLVAENGWEGDVLVANTLVDMYVKCRCIKNARELFDRMSEHDVVSWNIIISGHAQQGLSKEALDLYEQMKQKGLQPNTATLVVLLKACASVGALEECRQLHSTIIKQGGFKSSVTLSNTLAAMYAKCGCIDDAYKVFNCMMERDVVSWTTIIAGHAEHGLGKQALALYEQMKVEGIQLDSVAYVVILKTCGMMADLDLGKQLHNDMIKSRVMMDVTVGNALVDMYAKCGCINNAFEVFTEMNERDVVTWNVMVAGYAQQGFGKKAIRLLEQMRTEGMKPDEITYLSTLSACSHSGLVDEGCCLFEFMGSEHEISCTVDHYACMVDLLGRAGWLVAAENFIKEMPIQPDTVVWMTLLSAARNHGHVEIGRHAFDHVMDLEPEKATAYVLMSDIYAAAGRGDELVLLKQKRGEC